jgi:hypothetical protein
VTLRGTCSFAVSSTRLESGMWRSCCSRSACTAGCRAWTTFERDAPDRLHAKSLIPNQASRGNRSLLAGHGLRKSERLSGSCSAHDVSIPAESLVDGANSRVVNHRLTESWMVEQARPPAKSGAGRSAGRGKGGPGADLGAEQLRGRLYVGREHARRRALEESPRRPRDRHLACALVGGRPAIREDRGRFLDNCWY